jgi:hypothetical protein
MYPIFNLEELTAISRTKEALFLFQLLCLTFRLLAILDAVQNANSSMDLGSKLLHRGNRKSTLRSVRSVHPNRAALPGHATTN